jgi:hypothetical protein
MSQQGHDTAMLCTDVTWWKGAKTQPAITHALCFRAQPALPPFSDGQHPQTGTTDTPAATCSAVMAPEACTIGAG